MLNNSIHNIDHSLIRSQSQSHAATDQQIFHVRVKGSRHGRHKPRRIPLIKPGATEPSPPSAWSLAGAGGPGELWRGCPPRCPRTAGRIWRDFPGGSPRYDGPGQRLVLTWWPGYKMYDVPGRPRRKTDD